MRRRKDNERVGRVRLLSDELDRLRVSALERTRSIDTKSSFVVVAAGVVASATFIGLVDARTWFLGLIPLAFTIATIVVAAFALWPVEIDTPSGRDMVSEWVDADLSPADLEDSLLEVKALEIEYRDDTNESKAKLTKAGFILLILSVVTALMVVALNASSIPEGGNSHGETNSPSSTPTPEAP